MAEVVEQAEVDRLAQAALAQYDISPRSTLRLVNLSENWTYRVEDPDSDIAYALRVHRIGYHTTQEIVSELLWIDALQHDAVVGTVTALPAKSGERVIQLATDVLPERSVVLFAWEDGAPPDPDLDLVPVYHTLGAMSAGMHAHSRAWQSPANFTRFAWDFETALGPNGHWGPWQDAVGLDDATRDLFQRTVDVIDRRLQAYGKGPERYGLIHADMRPANVLVLGNDVRAIDFDDCGNGWFMYDFATTISFIEDHPMVPEWRSSWLEGYRSAGTLSAEDEAELDTFVMLRRLMLVCWIGSHFAHATEAQELGAGFTVATSPLAETYLSQYA